MVHFNEHVDKGYFEQLTAEHLKEPPGNRAGPKRWEKLRPRNERHDTAIYARALAHHLSDKMTPRDWDALQVLRGVPPEAAQGDMAAIWAGQPKAVASEAARQPETPAPAAPVKVNKFTGRSGGWL